MIGSRPVVGSSKKRISGAWAMARARPTRFCMPPESSAGISSPTSGPGRPWPGLDRLGLGRRGRPLRGEQAEGDVLPDRQAVEQGRALEQHAELAGSRPSWRATPTTSSPSILDRAAVRRHQAEDALDQHRLAGARAADHHQRARPSGRSRSTPSSTRLGPKLLVRPRIAILGGAARSSAEEQLGDDVVGGEDQDRGRDHGLGGGAPTPWAPPRGEW